MDDDVQYDESEVVELGSYSEVEKKRSELAVLELCEELEQAREAMHEARGDAPTLARDDPAMVAYNDLSDRVAAARAEHRKKFPQDIPPPDAPDGVALVEPVEVAGEVKPDEE